MDKKERVIIQRETLYKEVWRTPILQLAKKYGMSDVGLAKICKRMQIPLPPRGYWTKHAYGYKVRSKSLKPLADGGQKQVAIDRSTDQLADIARKRQASGKLKHKERQRVHRLQHELKEWEASHRVRAYIASLQAAGADAKPETAQWLLWVQKYADHLDPTVDFRIEVLDMT